MQSIKRKIVNFEVAKDDTVVPAADLDHDPTHDRVDHRPEGVLSAETSKVIYFTQEGRHSIYLSISYLPLTGTVAGQAVEIERPLEFFIPVGQTSEDAQWISALARQMSNTARLTGDFGAILADLQKVSWDKGPVRCGVDAYGKPRYHTSVVAAIAWSFIDMLRNRGIVDAHGELLPLVDRIENQRARHSGQSIVVSDDAAVAKVGDCPDCQSAMVLRDGCPTCDTCGYSKCG